MALVAKFGWKIHHLDIKSTFLNVLLEEYIYIEQPKWLQIQGNEDKVHKLHKALYGLKQAPWAWYNKINTYLQQQGFHKSEKKATLYVKKVGSNVKLIMSLYVDDLLVIGANVKSL